MPDRTMRDRILDAAERRARRGGYNAFSFREIANDVEVSSAAIHYHFATKGDLAAALTTRYTERIMEHLGDPGGLEAGEAVARVQALFRGALIDDDKMCLCGLFGAERDVLPAEVDTAVAGFFAAILDYLRTALGGDTTEPEKILATLEGALILARSMRDTSLFDRAIESKVGA